MIDDLASQLRSLPSVDEVVSRLVGQDPRSLVTAETRRVISAMRDEIRQGRASNGVPVDERVLAAIANLDSPSLRGVINATGVILHTNLGRAPLIDSEPVRGYSNLEYDLETGRRGKRDVHASVLLERLIGRPAIVVNNNAAAVYLTLNELSAGGEVIISRGELIEIGDGFRIPEIMACSGAVLREVGTTNRTHLDDYRSAVTDRTRLILRVHPSNFHISGFTEKPALSDLAKLARETAVPLYEDLGSGCLVNLRPYGIMEPLVSDSLEAGVNIVSFSCDKLLGGPQAGIIAGDSELVSKVRRNPMFRAFRVDKLIYSALGATLRALLFERFDEVPALHMIRLPAANIRERAEQFCETIGHGEVIRGESVIGGGSTPDQSLPTWLISIEGDAVEFERALRRNNPPVIARIVNDRVVLDLRTVFAGQESQLAAAVRQVGKI